MTDQLTSAAFRATRERLGLQQLDVAKAASITPMTIKRWGRGDSKPSEKGWVTLNQFQAEFDRRVELLFAAHCDSDTATLPYYCSQADLERSEGLTAPFGLANAAMVEAARLLQESGVTPVIEFADTDQ